MGRCGWMAMIGIIIATQCLTVPLSAGEYLIPKKEFRRDVRTLIIYPIADSLKPSYLELVDRIRHGVKIDPGDTINDARLQVLFRRVNDQMLAPYAIAYRTLRLDEPGARDSLLSILDLMIASKATGDGSGTVVYALADSTGAGSSDSLSAIFRPSLKLVEREVTRNRGRGQSRFLTCSVIIDAWVYGCSGSPLWHKQAEIDYIYEEAPLEKFMNARLMRDAVDELVGTLFK